MDRNSDGVVSGSGDYVALRKESVDRNRQQIVDVQLFVQSLSARRAWIEISIICWDVVTPMSLSARRAWIEMLKN